MWQMTVSGTSPFEQSQFDVCKANRMENTEIWVSSWIRRSCEPLFEPSLRDGQDKSGNY
ncbi:hypothetical protein L195_g016411 [Trifolium pratense]|uniref:Uncharacterized protein n=1 Tax=Trifolium pratense TaxID=57577 RepID=A0A2K3MR19_TRIPR|nr:hypothetical protein L195_g016411 [Trifolium pratense]